MYIVTRSVFGIHVCFLLLKNTGCMFRAVDLCFRHISLIKQYRYVPLPDKNGCSIGRLKMQINSRIRTVECTLREIGSKVASCLNLIKKSPPQIHYVCFSQITSCFSKRLDYDYKRTIMLVICMVHQNVL